MDNTCMYGILTDTVYAYTYVRVCVCVCVCFLCEYTAHNQSYKAHRNGIKKPQRQKYASLKGVRMRTERCSYSNACRHV